MKLPKLPRPGVRGMFDAPGTFTARQMHNFARKAVAAALAARPITAGRT